MNNHYLAKLIANTVIHKGAQVDDDSTGLVKRGLDIFAKTDTLPSLEEFVGQATAKKQIRLAIDASLARGERLGHVLLASGIAGVGKSTLAALIAYELGVGFASCSGPITVAEAKNLLSVCRDGDVLFIDECQTLGKGCSWILPLMTEGQLLTGDGAEQMPDVTIIGATTDQGKLTEALLSRFMHKPRLTHYSDQEGEWLVGQVAERMNVFVPYADRAVIALAGNNNPRVIRSILTTYRDMASSNQVVDMDELLGMIGVTRDGLDALAQDYLLALLGATNYTASVNTVRAIISEPGPLDLVEKSLISRGFMEIQSKGRKLSRDGVRRAKALL